jgi:hypothetical protein
MKSKIAKRIHFWSKLFRLSLELYYLRLKVSYSDSITGRSHFREMLGQNLCRPRLEALSRKRGRSLHLALEIIRYIYVELCHAKPIKWLGYELVNGQIVNQPDKHVIMRCIFLDRFNA